MRQGQPGAALCSRPLGWFKAEAKHQTHRTANGIKYVSTGVERDRGLSPGDARRLECGESRGAEMS